MSNKMSGNAVLKGELRTTLGTGPARELRRAGLIPATVYGNKQTPLSVSLEEKEVTKLYRKHGFTSTVVELDIAGKKHKVLPKSVDLHPITDLVRHADFVFVASKGTQKAEVQVVYEGKERSVGVKKGGFFNIIHRKIELNCPVDNIPPHVEVDVTNMVVGASLKARSLKLPEGCSLFAKKDFILASITGRAGKADPAEAAEQAGAPAAEKKA